MEVIIKFALMNFFLYFSIFLKFVQCVRFVDTDRDSFPDYYFFICVAYYNGTDGILDYQEEMMIITTSVKSQGKRID